jgi:hypothetical protein
VTGRSHGSKEAQAQGLGVTVRRFRFHGLAAVDN